MRIIGGEWGGRRISAPVGRDTRPTSDRLREAWMSRVDGWIADAAVLDLFAGSGALGIEALSRGAAHATFVENAPAAMRVLSRNLADLAVPADRFKIVRSDAIAFARAKRPERFGLAFADPPYASGSASVLASIFREHPFAELLGIEHSRGEAIPDGADLVQRRYGDTILTILLPDDDID